MNWKKESEIISIKLYLKLYCKGERRNENTIARGRNKIKRRAGVPGGSVG